MMHDWNITRNFVVFMDLPLVFDMDMAIEGGDPFGFRPECGARLGVMPRNGSNKDIKWIDINPCFVFHPMNAYEEDNKIILHVCRQDKAMVGGMDQIYGGDETTGKLWKWTLDLDTQSCKEEQIDDKPCDFARVDDRRTGLKANIGYAMELNNKAETLTFGNNLFKYNLDKGTREDHFLGDYTVGGEPLFAPNPNVNDEKDGYVMSIVHDNEKNQSKLLIIDSDNFSDKAVAEILLPQRVPFGAHGSWLEN
jgi:carotenoid cleavage dioxygenase